MKRTYTSESVGSGHPDKICDQISDYILDKCLKNDKRSLVACEVLISKNIVVIAGEINSTYKPDYEKIVFNVLNDINFENDVYTELKKLKIHNYIHHQSTEINKSFKSSHDVPSKIAAGDQGNIFGYACSFYLQHDMSYIPLEASLANEILTLCDVLRKSGKFKNALGDSKCQVTIEKREHELFVKYINISVQHTSDYNKDEFEDFIRQNIVNYILNKWKLSKSTEYLLIINSSINFTVGSFTADTGLTGRKIICDAYGSSCHSGGGCYSGKDPTKIDRSVAYYARYACKNIVAAGLCNELEIQISYCMSYSKPLQIEISKISNINDLIGSTDKMLDILKDNFDFSLDNIIKELNLLNISYYKLAKFGHFGNNAKNYPWEQLNRIKQLKKYLS